MAGVVQPRGISRPLQPFFSHAFGRVSSCLELFDLLWLGAIQCLEDLHWVHSLVCADPVRHFILETTPLRFIISAICAQPGETHSDSALAGSRGSHCSAVRAGSAGHAACCLRQLRLLQLLYLSHTQLHVHQFLFAVDSVSCSSGRQCPSLHVPAALRRSSVFVL